MRFNETSPAAPCTLTLPTRSPEVVLARYGSQVEAGEVRVVGWRDGYALYPPQHSWDYVVHGAATADPRVFMKDPGTHLHDTITLAASIANVARASASTRVLLISSGAVYGEQPRDLVEMAETYRGGPDITSVVSAYGEGKRVAELLFRASARDLRIALLFSVICPYQDLNSSFAVPDLILQATAQHALQLRGDGTARRSYSYASDLTAFLLKLLLGEVRHDVYNVGNQLGTVTIGDVSLVVAYLFGGLEVSTVSTETPSVYYVPQLSSLYEFFTPRVDLREGLLRMCHSLHARGLIDRKPVFDFEPSGHGS